MCYLWSEVRLRLSILLLLPFLLVAECRLPDVAPGAIERLSATDLLDSGHYRAALRILEPVAQARPGDGRIAWMISRAKAATGDLDDAAKLAEAAVASDDANADYHVQAAAVYGRMARNAPLLKQLTLAKRAKKELDAAVALEPANSGAQWGLMMFYYAVPGLIGGDKEKARAIGRQLARSDAALGQYYEGRLAAEMKDTASAENFYLRSATADPNSFDTAAELANFYIENKPDPAKAEAWACAALHADPTRADGWALVARTYAACGCWTEALSVAQTSETIDPDDLAPWYWMAAAAIGNGEQIESAQAWLRKYLGQPPEGAEPSWASAHWQMGLALHLEGKHDEAVAELKAAVEQEPSNEKARADLKRISGEKTP